jgi:hypothetical protein
MLQQPRALDRHFREQSYNHFCRTGLSYNFYSVG